MADDIPIELYNYYKMTNQQKDLFWLDTTNKFYNEIPQNIDLLFTHISFCVKLYLDSNDEGKDILWLHFHPLCKRLSDNDRYVKEK